MASEGTISVRLGVAKGHVSKVDIRSSRSPHTIRALAGRAPRDVVRTVPRLFAVCGMAHGVACARAVETALGRPSHPDLETARDAVVLAEAAVSHLWQLAIAWPEAIGRSPEASAVREARRLVAEVSESLLEQGSPGATLCAEPDWARASRATASLAKLVRYTADADPELLSMVKASRRAAFGRTGTTTLAHLDLTHVGRLLAEQPRFAERPELEGRAVDASAYARRGAAGDVLHVETRHGSGLLARLVARQVEARADAARLESLPRPQQASRRDRHATGEGVGHAHTARGPLVYWVRAHDGAVEDLRVVTPTDWTFHPEGVLHEALLGAEATSTLTRDAGWLVLALDPCVPWTVEVGDA